MNTYRTLNASRAVVTTLLTALVPLCPTTGAALEFANPVSYPVGLSPAAAAIGDFNGDGHSDIAVANSRSGNVSILLGIGDGTFKPAMNFDAGMASPTSIEVADFNNDGIQDLAVWTISGPVGSTLSILLGNGDGTFHAPKTLALPATVDQAALDLVIADFNLDHKPDLAVLVHDASGGASRIFLLAGNGDGTFQAPQKGSDVLSTVVGASSKYLATGDFNNDGKPDLAVQVSGGVEVLLGQGDGTLLAGTTIPITGGFVASDLKVGDFNGDGNIDVLAKSDLPHKCGTLILAPGTYSTLSLFRGNRDGSFQPEQIIDKRQSCQRLVNGEDVSSGGPPISIPSFGDFNGDGRLDLQYQISDTLDYIGVHLGREDGTFTGSIPDRPDGTQTVPLTEPLYSIVVVKDLNGDKLSDLIYLDSDNNAVVILLNTSPATGADLAITRRSATPQTDGKSTTYSAVIMNEGPEEASNVTFKDTFPDSVSMVTATTTQGNCTPSNGIVVCSVGSLKVGSEATVQFTVTLRPTSTDGTITNNMSVTALEPDVASANNAAQQDSEVFTLTVTRTGSGSGTVTSNSGDINCGAVCSQHYLSGSSIGLIATPAPGSAFSGWSDGGPCNDPSTTCGVDNVAMSGNQTVTATFSADPMSAGYPGGGGERAGGGGSIGLVDLFWMLSLGLWRALPRACRRNQALNWSTS